MKRMLVFLATFLCSLNSMSNDIRVEPSSWWVGMKNESLQIMLYGTKIADHNFRIDYPGVTVDKIVKTDNANYLFVYLTINAAQAKPGTMNIRLTDAKGKERVIPYQLNQRQAGSALRKGFDNADVIYLITPDRFANGDPSNDTSPAMLEGLNRQNEDGRHGGDLKGVLDHLDYVQDMGFTAIWMTPVLENNQPNYSYHGYSITDFYKVDPRLGSNELYRKLTQEADKRGIKMIMDMVFNHSGSGHWWMKDLPSKSWLNFPESKKTTNHLKSIILDPYVSKRDSIYAADGWFAPSMPDLNQKEPLLATYLIQNTKWWIEYLGLKGIRVDTYPYSDMNFMADWSREVMLEYPNFNIVGEQWSSNPALVAYWQKGKLNQNGYRSSLPSLMDFPVQDAIIKALTVAEKYNSGGLYTIYEMLANDFQYPDPNNLVVFLDNHDIYRYNTLINGNLDLYKIGISFLLTTRGTPQLFYGTEMLLTGESHGAIRTDFPGGWAGDKVNGFTQTGLTATQREAQTFLKKLLNWRKNTPVLENANLVHYKPTNQLYTYTRANQSGGILVVLSKNKAEQEIDIDIIKEGIGSATNGVNIITGESVQLVGKIKVPANGALIIEYKNR